MFYVRMSCRFSTTWRLRLVHASHFGAISFTKHQEISLNDFSKNRIRYESLLCVRREKTDYLIFVTLVNDLRFWLVMHHEVFIDEKPQHKKIQPISVIHQLKGILMRWFNEISNEILMRLQDQFQELCCKIYDWSWLDSFGSLEDEFEKMESDTCCRKRPDDLKMCLSCFPVKTFIKHEKFTYFEIWHTMQKSMIFFIPMSFQICLFFFFFLFWNLANNAIVYDVEFILLVNPISLFLLKKAWFFINSHIISNLSVFLKWNRFFFI